MSVQVTWNTSVRATCETSASTCRTHHCRHYDTQSADQKMTEISAVKIFCSRKTRPHISPNLGSKCLLARPLTMPNFVTIPQKVSEISAGCRQFVILIKWTKVHRNKRWPATHKCPLLCNISSCSVKRCVRKALQTSSSAIAERQRDACSTSNRKPVKLRLLGGNLSTWAIFEGGRSLRSPILGGRGRRTHRRTDGQNYDSQDRASITKVYRCAGA